MEQRSLYAQAEKVRCAMEKIILTRTHMMLEVWGITIAAPSIRLAVMYTLLTSESSVMEAEVEQLEVGKENMVVFTNIERGCD